MRQVWIFMLLLAAGCGKSASPPDAAPDPHDVPITAADVKLPASYAEAVPRIKTYRDAIRSAIESGKAAEAHRPLDELDIVLDKLPAIGKQSGIPIEQWETINSAAKELRSAFDQLHSAIDEQREPDYGEVASQIDQAIAKLEQVQP